MNEQMIFGLITASGNAKSDAMEAIQHAKIGDISEARAAIKRAEESLKDAHRTQTSLIQNEAKGDKIEVSILLIHAQDHLMNAMMIKEMALEFIDLYEKVGS